MGIFKKLFGSKNSPNNSKAKESDWPLRSKRTSQMKLLMDNAEGDVNLARKNRELFDNCEPWEGMTMAALACQRSCVIIMENITSKNRQNHDVAQCLVRVSNIMDGVPKYENAVSMFRNAPNDLESIDWITVARETAADWANAAKQFLEYAVKIKA